MLRKESDLVQILALQRTSCVIQERSLPSLSLSSPFCKMRHYYPPGGLFVRSVNSQGQARLPWKTTGSRFWEIITKGKGRNPFVIERPSCVD